MLKKEMDAESQGVAAAPRAAKHRRVVDTVDTEITMPPPEYPHELLTTIPLPQSHPELSVKAEEPVETRAQPVAGELTEFDEELMALLDFDKLIEEGCDFIADSAPGEQSVSPVSELSMARITTAEQAYACRFTTFSLVTDCLGSYQPAAEGLDKVFTNDILADAHSVQGYVDCVRLLDEQAGECVVMSFFTREAAEEG